uniref:Uncharacterized protein n=1 Tax=Arundo donax TaxID=35708 RepID=A0A0A9HGA8_ARUDO
MARISQFRRPGILATLAMISRLARSGAGEGRNQLPGERRKQAGKRR